jgi:hypothetical protein
MLKKPRNIINVSAIGARNGPTTPAKEVSKPEPISVNA